MLFRCPSRGEPVSLSVYIVQNDMEEHMQQNNVQGITIASLKLFMLLYADDAVLFAENKVNLQKAITHLASYCKQWKLTLNTEKTKVVVFRKSGRLPSNLAFYYEGTQLEIVNQFKYLGVQFSHTSSFTCVQQTLAGQAQKALFKIEKFVQNLEVKPIFMMDLFDKLVLPIVMYGAEVWGFHDAPCIEKLHLKYCKKVLKVKSSTVSDIVRNELGRVDIKTQRILLILLYWAKLVQKPDHRYVKQIYNVLLYDAENMKTNWVSNVKHVLYSLGMGDAWLAQGVGNIKVFKSFCKQRLYDNYFQQRESRFRNSSRGKFYLQFHSFSSVPVYHKCIISMNHLYAFIKFRSSSHQLRIETGRWHKPQPIPYNERLCRTCGKLDDEFHFIFECNLHDDICKQYISCYYTNNPSMYKFINLLQSENAEEIKKTGNFCL